MSQGVSNWKPPRFKWIQRKWKWGESEISSILNKRRWNKQVSQTDYSSIWTGLSFFLRQNSSKDFQVKRTSYGFLLSFQIRISSYFPFFARNWKLYYYTTSKILLWFINYKILEQKKNKFALLLSMTSLGVEQNFIEVDHDMLPLT